MPAIRKLADVLEGIKAEKWNHALFLKGVCPWTEDASCAVLSPDDSDDAETNPPFAIENGLKYALNMQDARGIVENARLQKRDVTTSDLVKAFNFYFQHDAFMAFT